MSDEIDYESLDPGIRRTVRILNEAGFYTSDSGDGSKAGAMACAVDYPMIVVPYDEETYNGATGEHVATMVYALLKGLTEHPTCWEPDLVDVGPSVEYAYLPHYMTGVIQITHFVDAMLKEDA